MENHLVAELLHSRAQLVGGSGLADEQVIQAAREEFGDIHFRIVRQWMILDVLVPETQEQAFKENGLIPTMLYFNRTVFDNRVPFAVDDAGIAGYQSAHDGCFYQTQDTLYVLAGRGGRKHVCAPAVLALESHVRANLCSVLSEQLSRRRSAR